MLTEKQMATIRAVEPGRFDCLYSDIVDIRDAEGGGALATGSLCFAYGFLKGRRAERAEAKKKAYRKAKKAAPGYGLLLALIEKNMGNEHFVQCMAAFAQGLTSNSGTSEYERVQEGA